jgi:peptidoglycan/xylan/chitin deacetylase (PgdA/CDA1 family)
MLTIVTYHYVRDVSHSRYPRIKALETRDFEGQLDYISRHYHLVGLEEVAAAARGETELQPNSCLLTFDDGLLDHFMTVFPRLARRGWCGCFFPVASACRNRRVLDVHKIQFILAVERDAAKLAVRIMDFVTVARKDMELPSEEAMWAEFARSDRYDGPELQFVKNTLQYGLPQPLRSQVVDALFVDHVAQTEDVIARELYMDLEQMRLMARAGMAFGGHGSHAWLGRSSKAEQRQDFQQSRAFLEEISGGPVEGWTMCYPCGSYNTETLEVAREARCSLGLTLRSSVVRDLSRPLELPRLDTTDLPFRGDGPAPAPTIRFSQEPASVGYRSS